MDADIFVPKFGGTYIDDALFVQLGFFTGTSTAFQRSIAYGVAESQMVRAMGTFIEPTTFTGTFPFVDPFHTIELPVGQIISVNDVRLYERVSDQTDRIISGTSMMLDPRNGYIRIDISRFDNSSCSGCPGTVNNRGIYKAEISVTAGYQTGMMVNNPSFIAALGMAADIVTKELSDEGLAVEFEEGPIRTLQVGRVIKTVDTKRYMDTPFGESYRAKTIRNLIKPLIIKRVGKLGR